MSENISDIHGKEIGERLAILNFLQQHKGRHLFEEKWLGSRTEKQEGEFDILLPLTRFSELGYWAVIEFSIHTTALIDAMG